MRVEEGRPGDDVVIGLRPGATLAGKVRTAAGAPPSGLLVRVARVGDARQARTTRLQEDGTFQLGQLAAGNYDVSVERTSRSGPGGSTVVGSLARQPAVLIEGETTTLDLVVNA